MQIRRLPAAFAVTMICVSLEMLWVWHSGMAVPTQGSYIKYVDFNVPRQALEDAAKEDINREGEVNWIDILAALACKNGAQWSKYKTQDTVKTARLLENGETPENSQYFEYYRDSYNAVLGGILGDFTQENQNQDGEKIWSVNYGIKAFSPIASGYYYTDSDDFGVQRTYGYKRRHLGHDMMALVGTPVIAVESGTIVKMGWNKYGGWRIGIRSSDKKRYWYYAHLRKDRPYAEGLKEGDTVTAGDVIGYVGKTGYSSKQNVNNIETPHLHIGLELIFDESQFESDNEIWVDIYPLMCMLNKNKSQTIRLENGEHQRKYKYIEAGQ